MQKFNTLYVCPKHFILKTQGDVSNILPYGSIISINIENITIRLYNGDKLELDVSYEHPDVKPLYVDHGEKVNTVFIYDSYDNRGKASYDPKKFKKLKSEADTSRNKYVRRSKVVCRRELRSLIKQWDAYISKVDGII